MPILHRCPLDVSARDVFGARCRSDRRHNHTTPRPRHARPPVWRACASMAPTGTQTARDDVLRTLVLRECACDGDGHRTARISDADVAEDSVRRRVTVTRGRVARRRARARHGARDSAPVPTYAHRSTRSPHSSSGPAEKGVPRRPKTSCCLELLDFAASVRHTIGGCVKNEAHCVQQCALYFSLVVAKLFPIEIFVEIRD